ncbi:MAG TPA: tRNA (adenosine(37)-N6)-threonylcarbamoyltransferase complex dimerization subunit type 1 TsaB [Clostridia bacterium]|nr:tRNA (adenosine(37)-N6)-threonylcarbamoyltransferase complex dimerization subunit type 1 TsaB [Clostridia bacterium]
MRLLAADTSAKAASVALFEDGRLIYESFLNNGLTHSEKFMPMISEALDVSGIKPSEIDVFACTSGPGSFTGIRIGVETIKALAHANHAKCIGVSTIEALAANSAKRTIAPIMDARRNQVYCGIFHDGKRILEDCAIGIDELFDKLDAFDKVCFVGDGVPVYRKEIEARMDKRAVFVPEQFMFARASSVGIVALKAVKTGDTVEYFELNPVYLRKSQAEREYDKR